MCLGPRWPLPLPSVHRREEGHLDCKFPNTCTADADSDCGFKDIPFGESPVLLAHPIPSLYYRGKTVQEMLSNTGWNGCTLTKSSRV